MDDAPEQWHCILGPWHGLPPAASPAASSTACQHPGWRHAVCSWWPPRATAVAVAWCDCCGSARATQLVTQAHHLLATSRCTTCSSIMPLPAQETAAARKMIFQACESRLRLPNFQVGGFGQVRPSAQRSSSSAGCLEFLLPCSSLFPRCTGPASVPRCSRICCCCVMSAKEGATCTCPAARPPVPIKLLLQQPSQLAAEKGTACSTHAGCLGLCCRSSPAQGWVCAASDTGVMQY